MTLPVDGVDEKPGLPKALNPIRPCFDDRLKKQRRHESTVVLNINITRINREDVKMLTEIGRDHNVMTDDHINEAPMIEQDHVQPLADNRTYLRPEDSPRVDDLVDDLIDKSRQGYTRVNPKNHLAAMKDLLRGQMTPSPCRAGQNSLIVWTDRTLAPDSPVYSVTHDWGIIEDVRGGAARRDEVNLPALAVDRHLHPERQRQHAGARVVRPTRTLGFRGVSERV